MLQGEITIRDLKHIKELKPTYADDDIVFFDDVKVLTAPKPHRVAENALIFVIEGRGEFTVNGNRVVLEKNHLIVCPPGVGFSNIICSPDFEVRVVYFTSRILQSFLREKIDVWNELIYARHVRVLGLESKNVEFFRRIYDLLRVTINFGKNHPYYTDLVQLLMKFTILGIDSGLLLLQGTVPPNSGGKRPDKLFKRFIDLLHSTSGRHCTVESMAEKLCVSAKHLSNVCKKNSGKTASAWIEEQVQEEIRYYLQQTDMGVKQICYELGFSSPSFFCKYVRTHFGKTPLELRRG